MEKTVLTIEIFEYERNKNVNCDEQYAQILQFAQYVSATEIWRHCSKYDRAFIDISLQAAEIEDQNRSCPRREKKDGRVLSLASMKPR